MRKALSKNEAQVLHDVVRNAGSGGIYVYKLPMMLKVSAVKLLKFIRQSEDIYDFRDGKLFLLKLSEPMELNDTNSVMLRSGRRIPIMEEAIGDRILSTDFYLPVRLHKIEN